eukprot:4253590-Alexandrium_andersonii.AAC.1
MQRASPRIRARLYSCRTDQRRPSAEAAPATSASVAPVPGGATPLHARARAATRGLSPGAEARPPRR